MRDKDGGCFAMYNGGVPLISTESPAGVIFQTQIFVSMLPEISLVESGDQSMAITRAVCFRSSCFC